MNPMNKTLTKTLLKHSQPMLKQKNDFFNDFKRFENDTFLEEKKKTFI